MNSSAWVALLVGLAAGNPARRALPLAGHGLRLVASGAAPVALTLVALGLAAGPVLRALEVSVPTVLVGAGLVVGATSLVDLVAGRPAALPGLDRRGAMWCPVAFPHLLRPQLAVAVLAAGAAHGALSATVAALVPLALTVALARFASPGASLGLGLVAVGRMLAALGVLAAVDLVIDGVFAV